MNTYICQFCKQSYQSDGLRKPLKYKKDGSIFRFYSSKLFCSKECCLKQVGEKFKQTLLNNPEIMKKRVEKFKQTIKDHPNIMKQASEKFKQTLKNNPEILKKRVEKYKQTLLNNPEIIEKMKKKQKQTYKNHPEIAKNREKKYKQTLSNNPEILEKKVNKIKQIYKNHPEIAKNRVEKYKQTLSNNPKILENKIKKYKQTLSNNPEIMKKRGKKMSKVLKKVFKNHPEIVEKARDKAYQTMKEKGFISKEEQEMIRLLRDRYGNDDIIEQYKDNRYMKPETNYHYACDCYIKSLDLFIEYNGSRFHPTEENREKLKQEIKNFQLKYPGRSIEECQAYALLDTIEKDKIKQQVAKDNHLNYLIVTKDYRELYENNIL